MKYVRSLLLVLCVYLLYFILFNWIGDEFFISVIAAIPATALTVFIWTRIATRFNL